MKNKEEKSKLPKANLMPHPTNPNLLIDKIDGRVFYFSSFSVKLIQLNEERD